MRGWTLAIALAACGLAVAAKVPRKSPELVIPTHDGKQVRLSDYRGKVVVIEVLLTTCQYCQRSAQMLNRLQAEYGARGFQAIGVAFNDLDKDQIGNFARAFGVKFPVGFVPRDAIYNYLQADKSIGIHVPNLVFIDRSGTIRHQSLPQGDSETSREDNVRPLIEQFLREKPRAAPRKSAS
jgi:peroxiredoxin